MKVRLSFLTTLFPSQMETDSLNGEYSFSYTFKCIPLWENNFDTFLPFLSTGRKFSNSRFKINGWKFSNFIVFFQSSVRKNRTLTMSWKSRYVWQKIAFKYKMLLNFKTKMNFNILDRWNRRSNRCPINGEATSSPNSSFK